MKKCSAEVFNKDFETFFLIRFIDKNSSRSRYRLSEINDAADRMITDKHISAQHRGRRRRPSENVTRHDIVLADQKKKKK